MSPKVKVLIGALAAVVLFSAIVAANFVTTDFGFVPVGFGLEATAGTFFAGIALAARDAIQDTWGRRAVVGVILLGTVLSFGLSVPEIAFASAAAFLTAEMLDFMVYTPLRARARVGDRRWAVAVVASNVVGALVDTVVFLGIAFGLSAIEPAILGQLVGKSYATIAYLLVGFLGAGLWQTSRGRAQ